MGSVALEDWQTGGARSLDEVVRAHTRLGGTSPGRRALTEINYAYVIRLAAHFQGYVRALHTEAAASIVAGVPDPSLRVVVLTQLTQGRTLDRGNASLANIGQDFGRFGFAIWPAVEAHHRHNADRKRKLAELLEWRNGIAHDDLARRRAKNRLVPGRVTMGACRTWRRALDNLALSVDHVVADQCEDLGCPRPW